MFLNIYKNAIPILVLSVLIYFLNYNLIYGSSSPTFSLEILSYCGNDIAEGGEACDGLDLNGNSCTSNGFSGGDISCSVSCTINTSMCTEGAASGGAGGGYNVSVLGSTVIFEGWAYPYGDIVVLKDGQKAASVKADKESFFHTTVVNVSGGDYVFSVYAEDKEGLRSGLFTFPVSITPESSTRISGILIAPTVALDKKEVKQGESIQIVGYSVKDSPVEIYIDGNLQDAGVVNTDGKGFYQLPVSTVGFDKGEHLVKVKVVSGDNSSTFSKIVRFQVGVKNVLALAHKSETLKGDLNNDGRVNLVDFSIASFWGKKSLADDLKTLESLELNGDGKIDLVDFSIMAHYWTG